MLRYRLAARGMRETDDPPHPLDWVSLDECQRAVGVAEKDAAHQRRHRKWALSRAKEWCEKANLCWSSGETVLADVMYENEQFQADGGKLAQRVKVLVSKATRLLHACERADEDGDLPECIDGTLFDDLRAALEEKP